VKSTKGVTSPKFLIRDLAGTSGRLDIICRCLLGAFSFGYQDIFFHTVLNGPPAPPKAIEFFGNFLEPLPSDEIGVAKLFQALLVPQIGEYSKGIRVTSASFLEVSSALAQQGPLFLLQEKVAPLRERLATFAKSKAALESVSFVLGDHLDLTEEENRFLKEELEAIPVSLGAESYLASHCIVFVLMELQKFNFSSKY
jgi:tRNA (pseudouridine54-N1)-methyltransferase